MASTRLQIAKKDILQTFNSMEQNILKHADIGRIVSEHRDSWRLAQSMTMKKFIDYLIKIESIKKHTLKFPSRTELRYIWGEASDYELIQSLRPDSYFSHFTAMFLHGFTQQIPKTMYLNYEQSKKKSAGGQLIQTRIDLAFKNACRVSNTLANFREKKVCLLNGKFTGQEGVTTIQDDFGKDIRVTNAERTLIDCVVRPVYSGGVHSVLTAFKMAANTISVNKLAATLSKLSYIYPYHQAIGFYLERSGVYSEKQISLIERIDKHFDFYLNHQMKEVSYSERWRLHYPSRL